MTKKLKPAKSTNIEAQPFTRSEFALLLSLIEAEGMTDLARTNERYSAVIADLASRINSVAYPDADHWPTDRVVVR